MKRKILVLMLLCCLGCGWMLGCGHEIQDESTEQTYSAKDAEEPYLDIPQFVKEVYDGFKRVIDENEIAFDLSEITGKEEGASAFYSFSIIDPDTLNEMYIDFYGYEGEIDKRFELSIEDDLDSSLKKRAIECAIATINNSTYKDAKKATRKLVAEFDGTSQTSAIDVGEYLAYITPSTSALLNDTLSIVSKDSQNKEIDFSQYEKFTPKEMRAKFNQGEFAYIKGTIKKMMYIKSIDINALIVMDGKNKYLVYYDPEDFIGILKKGKKGVFYGQIAAKTDGYAGCLRIDYFDEK